MNQNFKLSDYKIIAETFSSGKISNIHLVSKNKIEKLLDNLQYPDHVIGFYLAVYNSTKIKRVFIFRGGAYYNSTCIFYKIIASSLANRYTSKIRLFL